MKLKIIWTTLLLVLTIYNSNAQIDYKFFTGAQKGESDTIAGQKSFEMSNKATGLLEKEINPDKYVLGPNDEFSIGISLSRPRQFDVRVAPDGKLLIPSVGVVDLKGKTLSEAYILIKQKISKIYKEEDVDIVLKDVRKFKVSVGGAIAKPNIVPATPVDRVSEVIERAGGLKYDASLRQIKILRNNGSQIVHVDLLRYFLLGEDDANPYLLGGDNIIVPINSDKAIIGSYGEVNSPGEFEFRKGDSLSTLIKFSLGFLETAKLDSVEFVRYNQIGSEKRILDLTKWPEQIKNSLPLSEDFELQIGDRVYVREIQNRKKTEYIIIKGEVTYPGKYAIDRNNEKVSDLIKRAGGFTEDASTDLIEFIRQSERDKPDEEMERLNRIQASEMSMSEFRYYQSRKLEKRGVMSIDFKRIISDPKCEDNIYLKHRDSIVVPSAKSFINVQGRVANPGMITYLKGMNYMDYITRAGGFGFRADEGETIVTKTRGGQFLAKDFDYKLEPGDVILVPPIKEVSIMEGFTTGLTILSQLLTIAGVVFAVLNAKK